MANHPSALKRYRQSQKRRLTNQINHHKLKTQLKKMRPGQSAKVHVDAYGRDYNGHVDSFGGATAARFSLLPPENATGNYVKVVQRVPVKIVFEKNQDPEHMLRPGMSVEAKVLIK